MVQSALAGVLNDLRDDGELGEVFYARSMEPRRRSVAAMLARAADRDEIAPPTQPGVIPELLTGPLLLRTALPPIGPIDDTLVNATIEAALTDAALLITPPIGQRSNQASDDGARCIRTSRQQTSTPRNLRIHLWC